MNICGLDVVVDYSYTIVSRGCKAHMGSTTYAGHPAEPMWYEVEVEGLREDLPDGKTGTLLDLPDWLKSQIESELEESDAVYNDIDSTEWSGP
jgi:hypothetical protein